MKKILREEINRGIKSRGMLLALSIGLAISLSHVVREILPTYRANAMMDFEKTPIIYPFTIGDRWLAGNIMSVESFLYFLVVPILAVLPFGTSYFSDMQSGFLKGIYMRISRKQYMRAKYIAVFLSGGIAVVVPLLANLLFALAMLPNISPATILPYNGLCSANLFYGLYITHPLAYIFLFLCLDFLMGGMFACIGLACSYLSDYKIIVAICPFFLQLAVHVVLTMLNQQDFSSVYFMQSGNGITDWRIVLLYFVVGIGVSAAVFFKKGERQDVF